MTSHYVEAAFVFAVTGAALTPWPWLALIVGAGFMVVLAVVSDRRTPPVDVPDVARKPSAPPRSVNSVEA